MLHLCLHIPHVCICFIHFLGGNWCSGELTVCEQKSASLTLAGCLLEDKGIDYSILHLNDQTCKGEMDNLTHMVTFRFDSRNTCGTVVTVSTPPLGTIFTLNKQPNPLKHCLAFVFTYT